MNMLSVFGLHTKKKLILSIENVQRRATKIIKNIKHLTYEERLRYLDVPTLVYRRARGDMIEMYKIVRYVRYVRYV